MSDGYFLIYTEFRKRTFSFQELKEVYESKGILFKNPDTEGITRISNEGIPVESSQEAINRELDSRKEVSLNWWLNGSTNLYARLRWLEGNILVEEYGLDGLDEEEMNRVVALLKDRFIKLTEEGLGIMMFMDRSGESEEEDWDGLVLGKHILWNSPPELIGANKEWANMLGKSFLGWKKEEYQSSLIFLTTELANLPKSA